MTEAHRTHDQQQHVESHAPYMKIFYILLVLTVLEYFYAKLASHWGFSLAALILGLMALAVTKAMLVGMYFMHLKFEGRWVYLMLLPACLLAIGFICALYPDIGQQRSADQESADDELSAVAPLFPGRAAASRPLS